MKAALALLMTAGSAFGAAPTVQLAPSPVFLSPFGVMGTPLALQAQPSMVFSAPSLPLLASPLALSAPAISDVPDDAYAEKRKEAATEVQHAHAEIPVVDSLKRAYDESSAKEFMDGEFLFDGGPKKTGRELLSYLVTPDALQGDQTPDPARVDFNRLGKTSAQIRETVDAEGVPYHPYERVLAGAFREGLIYRLYSALTGFTYHGVPHEIRAAFGLEAPVVEDRSAEKTAAKSEFGDALARLAAEAVSLDDAELFEFTAQAVDAAIKAGKLPADAVSAKFRARADALGYDVPSLKDAVITLTESAEGTPWESKTAALLALLD